MVKKKLCKPLVYISYLNILSCICLATAASSVSIQSSPAPKTLCRPSSMKKMFCGEA